ncbi:MAG: CARDB domain-containing protein [archaeon]
MKLNYLMLALVLAAGFAYACNPEDIEISYYSPVDLGDMNQVSLVIWTFGGDINNVQAMLDLPVAFVTADTNPVGLGNLLQADWYYQNNSVWSVTAVQPGVYNMTVNVTHDGGACQARTEVVVNAPTAPELEVNITDPGTIYANQTFTLAAHVTNVGSGTANNVNATLQVDGQTVVTGGLERIYPQLYSANSVHPTFTITSLTPGFHTYRVVASDAEGDYVFAEITKELLMPPLVRDVAITALAYTPDPVPPGTNATITATVENQGQVQAVTYIHFNVNGGYLGNQSVDLAPGSSQTYQVSVYFGSEGTFPLNSTVDFVAGETDLSDNFAARTLTVRSSGGDDGGDDGGSPGGGGGSSWSGSSSILECYSDDECLSGQVCYENVCVVRTGTGGEATTAPATGEKAQLKINVLTEEIEDGGIIEIMVVDEAGSPVDAAEVRKNGASVGKTGADGKMLIPDIHDGDMIWAGKAGYISYQVEIDIAAPAGPTGLVTLGGMGFGNAGLLLLMLLLLGGSIYFIASRSLVVDIAEHDAAQGRLRLAVSGLSKKPVSDALVAVDNVPVGQTDRNGRIGIGGIGKKSLISVKKKGFLPAQKQLKN